MENNIIEGTLCIYDVTEKSDKYNGRVIKFIDFEDSDYRYIDTLIGRIEASISTNEHGCVYYNKAHSKSSKINSNEEVYRPVISVKGSDSKYYQMYVTRLYWALTNKENIPYNHDLHHICMDPKCINPSHLVPLTRANHMLVHKDENSYTKFNRVLSTLKSMGPLSMERNLPANC